jgi:hypothetical protein
MRTIFEFSAENAEIADWVADDPVRCELLSRSNSLMIRENTGNFRDFGPLGDRWQPKKPYLLWSFCRNSLLNGTGNLEILSGNFITGSGNLQTISRERLASLAHRPTEPDVG